MKDLCIGIDLGTTNSVVSIVNEKPNGDLVSKVLDISRPTDMYNSLSGEAKLTTMKKSTLPSCVYYRLEKNFEPLVGDFAKMQYSLRPHLVAKSIKSQMGNPHVSNLSPDIPDTTPQEVSARILKHILKETAKVNRVDKIEDAIICTPANFDSSMCKATLEAARLAGIKVKNDDGSERAILLTEPNAVIYDLINQIKNGEISNTVLDLSTEKIVLVFDIGGGTLDITMHKIKRREGYEDVLKVDEIATNRYTRIGGDDFDEAIANVMYQRYLNQYDKYPKVKNELINKKDMIMPQLRVYAENLKLELNERCSDDYDSGWDDFDDEDSIFAGGNVGGLGYSYDDSFTKEEIEDILSSFMAKHLNYDDYKRIDTISNTNNIIYPILDVLNKASIQLGVENVKVDAVIVNGGMSKFYMVTNRLKEFFGFDPIVALDPDLAVARGAAIYHYYLKKYNQSLLQDDMRLVGKENLGDDIPVELPKPSPRPIEWGKTILNDSLYLGLKNGEVQEIISTGTTLPYDSVVMTGFKIGSYQNRIDIPIKSKNLDGTYRTIANGSITFNNYYQDEVYVAFKIHMSASKLITMTAWTCQDQDGINQLEEGSVELKIIQSQASISKNIEVNTASGIRLDPKNEISRLVQLCNAFEHCKASKNKNIAKDISELTTKIKGCDNKADFAKVILDTIQSTNSLELKNRLYILTRRIGASWKISDLERLSRLCMSQLQMDIMGFEAKGPKVSVNTQAIYTLSICGSKDQLKQLSSLHKFPKYYQACLYTHGKTKTEVEWLQQIVMKDCERAKTSPANSLQSSAYAIGMVLSKDSNQEVLPLSEQKKIVSKLIHTIQSGKLQKEGLICVILALGLILDQRKYQNALGQDMIQKCLDTINHLDTYYNTYITMYADRSCQVADKMINGDVLSKEEEQFLLTKLEM